MATTIKAIAEQTGLSAPTVSHILSDGPRSHLFREQTRKRVLEIARQMGYRPNASARSMKRGRFGAVSLLTNAAYGRAGVAEGLLIGVCESLGRNGLHLVLAQLSDQQLAGEALPKVLQECLTDGLLINHTVQIPREVIAGIDQSGLPAIWINSKQDADCICPDELTAGREATQRLIELGHRRIAYLDYSTYPGQPGMHFSGVDREEGYRQAMVAAGLAPRVIREAIVVPRSQRFELVRNWMNRSDRPTAIVAAAASVAVPAWAAAVSLGIDVPRELSLITFAERVVDNGGIEISTMLVPERELGEQAVEMLVEKIKTPTQNVPNRRLPLKLSGTVTCAAAPK